VRGDLRAAAGQTKKRQAAMPAAPGSELTKRAICRLAHC
jgi:hypothetical protein